VDPKTEGMLAEVVDWTVFSKASEWRYEQEKAERERLGVQGPPRPLTREEIQEARVRQANVFEELDRKVRGVDVA